MSITCTSRAQLLRPTGWAGVLILGLGGVVGCSAEPLFKNDSINCTSVEADYVFDSNVVSSPWCSGDTTPHYDAAAEIAANTTESVLGGGPCDLSTYAMVLRTSHYNDWGSTCGFSGFILENTPADDAGVQLPIPRDESAYDGISFWARAAEGTSIGFTLSLDDANTTTAAKGLGGHCKEYNAIDGGIAGSTTVGVADPATGQVLTGVAVASRQPDECGNNKSNGYSYVMAVTNLWAFYTIPWANFTQAAYPNRVPNSVLAAGTVPGTGLLTNQLFGVNIRPPKEAAFELWVDNMRFYKKVQKSGPDAGLDVAQM
jgi:hypothetical protein